MGFKIKKCFILLLILGFVLPVASHGAGLPVEGYIEQAYGVRYDEEGPIDKSNVLDETRLMLEHRWYGRGGEVATVKALAKHEDEDNSDIEVREASIFLPLGTAYELNVGRQVLSWGPARYEFVNDRFTKDYRSFFLGRDMEYLKAPNDALKLSRYGDWFNLDLVLMPDFDGARLPQGRNIPGYHPGEQELVAGDSMPGLTTPKKSLDNGEVHLRLHRMIGRWEAALYGYRGFTSTPVAYSSADTSSYHPELAAVGFSLRGPLMGTVVWLEGGYEDIRDDGAGIDRNLPTDQYIFLTGFEYQTSPTVTYMMQGSMYVQDDASERRAKFDSDDPESERESYRLQLATNRTYFEERLTLEARGFVGFTEEDW
jgi:hypothetical protein